MYVMLKRFTKLRYFVLAIAALALFAGAASAFSPNPYEMQKYETLFPGRAAAGNFFTPHAEKIVAAGDKLYGLYTYVDGNYSNYLASEIVEFDKDLNKVRSVKLEDADGNVGKNAEKMALHDGKLYVACLGGYQGVGTFGDFWEVDTTAMTAKRVLSAKDIPALSGKPDVLPYGISIAADGTAFLLCLTYEADYSTSVKLFVTDVKKLSAGDAGTAVDYVGSFGYSWDVKYDDTADVLWCMAGSDLQIRDKAGALVKTFTPSELGNNIGTITVLADTGAGKPGLFYTAVAADYTGGSAGIVTKDDATNFTVTPVGSNYASDIRGYAFKDHNNAGRVLVREWLYSGTDVLYVWDVADWSKPVLNAKDASTNIHDAIADGQYLYLATYESPGKGGVIDPRGEFVRLDMKDGYKRDKNYQIDYLYEKGDIAVIVPTLPAVSIPSVDVNFVGTVGSADFVASSDFAIADLNVADNGTIALNDTLAKQYAEKLLASGDLNGTGIDKVLALPIFKATMYVPGNIAAVGFLVTGEALMAEKAASVQVMKVRGKDDAPLAFAYVNDPAKYADGTFTILHGSTTADALAAADSYTLVLFIKDNGDYDLEATDALILDPAVIVKTSTGGGGSGGSSGCDMGGASVLALLAAAALFQQTRRCSEKK